MMNNSEGKKLVPKIAEQLIIELFAGQTIQLNEIKAKVEQLHQDRGGLPHTSKYHPVPTALRNLKTAGKVENPNLGYWKIHRTEDTSTEPTIIRLLDDFIKWAGQFEEREFVFRGVSNERYEIEASAYRRPDENERSFEKFLYINKHLIRAARQRGYDRSKIDGTAWNDLDILVELQHYGAATCLIDFSYSAQIALWFACRHVQKKDISGESQNTQISPNGKVSAVQIKRPKYTEITPEFMKGDEEKTIDFFLKEEEGSPLYYLKPKFQNNRIIAQQSVLLFGNHALEPDEECFIDEGCKNKILTDLERTTGYTEDRLFPDFEGFAWVNREAASYTEPTYSALIDFGERAVENEKYEEALDYSSRAIEKDPNRIQAFNLRGRAYTLLEDYEKASEDFNNAEEIEPDVAETFFNRGCLYQQQHLYSEAINSYDIAISKKKEYGEAYYRRGQSKYDMGQEEEALTDFERALPLQPNSPYVHYWLGLTKQRLGQEEFMKHFDEAIRLKPDYFDAYIQRGQALQKLDQFSSALNDFNKAIELNTNDISVYIHKGETLMLDERSDDARQVFEVGLELAKQQSDDVMIAKINSLLQEVSSPNTSEEEDE